MRRVRDTWEGTWLAKPWGSISGDALQWGWGRERWGQRDSSSQKALGCAAAAQGGGPWLLYHSAVSSLHGSALWEAGKAAEPPARCP